MVMSRKTGWIGIDVGTSSVKIAQLSRSDGAWRLATAIVPRRDPWPAELTLDATTGSTLDELSAARSLEPGFRGRPAACILPMTISDVHTFDAVSVDALNETQTIRRRIETATQQSTAPLEVDHWTELRNGESANGGWTNAFTLVRTWGDQLTDDVARAGWSCRTIDALPFAMARAATLTGTEETSGPLAVLDWGYSRATLCVVVNRRPTYVRCLKGCGFDNVIEALSQALRVNSLEAASLLAEHGLPGSATSEVTDLQELIHDAISDQLEQLVAETRRSVEHFQYQRRTTGPREMLLLGGGATINSLEHELSRRLEMKVSPWRLPGARAIGENSHDADPCLFAAAAALSALAWSKR